MWKFKQAIAIATLFSVIVIDIGINIDIVISSVSDNYDTYNSDLEQSIIQSEIGDRNRRRPRPCRSFWS